MEYKTPKEYALEHPEVKWSLYREEFYLYRTSSQRFKITVERGEREDHLAWYLGLADEYSEAGIDEDLLDAEAFADDFINQFCHQLSLYDLRVLIPKLQKHYDDWEARRQSAIELLNSNA